jgi:hypothetical protein
MYSLRYLPLIIFMRGVTGCVAMLIDIIQLRFFILQALLSNKMALCRRFIILFSAMHELGFGLLCPIC